MKKLLTTLFVTLLCSSCVTTEQEEIKPVRIEIRAAETKAAPGYKEMVVAGTDETVFVGATVIISNQDIVGATYEEMEQEPYTQIELTFSKAGKARFAAATASNLEKPMAFLIDGRLVFAPTVREPIKGGRVALSGDFSDREASDIVRRLNAHL